MSERTQWHPLLAQFLKHDYGDKLYIRDAVPLGKMPLEMDLLIKPKAPIDSLPYPFNHIGKTTIGEFKSPEDTANWKAVTQIEGYACLYQRLNVIKDREQITLWLIASEFTKSFNEPPCDYIDNLTQIGEGLKSGYLHKFPIYLIELSTLPITLHTIPLLLVYGGDSEREKEIIRFVIKYRAELQEYLEFLPLHAQAFKEVLNEMDTKYLYEMDIDWEAMGDAIGIVARRIGAEKIINAIGTEKAIGAIGTEKAIEAIGTEKAIEAIGTEKAIEAIGAEKAIEAIGREKILDSMLDNLTPEEIERITEQLNIKSHSQRKS